MIGQGAAPNDTNGLIHLLAQCGTLGLVWADAQQMVQFRAGHLADFIPVGAPLHAKAAPFMGLERELLALQDEDHAELSLPRVGLFDTGEEAAKLSIDVIWDAAADGYAVVLHRSSARSGLEDELVRQIRSRRLAEDNYRRAAETIADKQNLLDAVVSFAPAPLAIFDASNNLVLATESFCDTFGFRFDPIAGKSFASLFPTEKARAEIWFRECGAGQNVTTDACLVQAESGKTHVLRWHFWPWRHATGAVRGVIAFGEVITAAYARERYLISQIEDLTRANADLDDFSALVAHDLRAPMRLLASEIQTLTEDCDSDRRRDIAERAQKRLARMDSILSGLLDYAKLQRASSAASRVDVSLLVETIASEYPNRDRFAFVISAPLGGVEMPVAALDLILRNLIQNAIAHHDRSEGKISVEVEDRDHAHCVAVCDDGPGMIPAFGQGSSTRSSVVRGGKRGGAGLGLSLVQKVVERHGGAITIESNPALQRGTRVVIIWPKADCRGVGFGEITVRGTAPVLQTGNSQAVMP